MTARRPGSDGVLVTWTRPDGRGEPAERTALDRDGTVWLWVREAAESARSSRVGTFRSTASPDQLAEAARLVAQLRGPDADRATASTADAGVVDVVAGDLRLRLAPGRERGAAAELLRLGALLTKSALDAPLSVVALEASAGSPVAIDLSAIPDLDPAVLAAIPRPASPGDLVLRATFACVGSEPVAITIDPDGFQAHWSVGGRPVSWSKVPTLARGLGGDEYFDGLTAPARIPPGASAVASIPLARPTEAVDAVAIRVSGRIELVGPWQSLGIPAEPFVARSAPGRVDPADAPSRPRTN